MKNPEMAASAERPLPMSLILIAATAVHLPLLLMKLPLASYDTNFQIFFASHYVHHWFDPWNPKWYAGFSQTTYPPLPQQWVALLSRPLGLEMAYMAVQFVAILLLALGAYRFARLWVSPRAASYAALASVFLGSEALLVYSAGQLATTFAAPIYLNALPYMYEWIREGRKRSFLNAVVLFAAAAAAHHATLIFGSVLFAAPVIALAFLDRDENSPASVIFYRTIAIVVLSVIAVAVVILPFWIFIFHHPVKQTPIPHASRANFILSPHWGINYFVIPWGAVILALPFIFIRGSRVLRLRPLMFGFWVAFLLGLGGTTPAASIILQRAFRVLTMERFSYWATLLALPFLGLLAMELIDRFHKRATIALTIAAMLTCGFGVAYVTYRRSNVEDVDVRPVAMWLNRGGHDRYRYITLGFSNQLSRLATLTDASSVDGEWNSVRQLPELTKYGAGILTDSKYYDKSGMEALRAMLRHANRYGLKWVFVRDPYYDPLLYFAGWRQVDDLDNKTVTVWSKDGVPPAEPVDIATRPPHWQDMMWGILPFGSSLLAIAVVLIPDMKRRKGRKDDDDLTPEKNLEPRRVTL